jgi:NodT family efflux transporter outer membrane factor (OMF) lipoprotein
MTTSSSLNAFNHRMPVMRSLLRTAIAGSITLSLIGCAVQPAQHASLPDSVHNVAPQAWAVTASTQPLDVDAWWRGFGDPVLHALIASVLDQNLDVRAAVERVAQADALVRRNRAELAPELDATATLADARQNVPPPVGYVREEGIGVSLNWAPDVFGGERLALLAAQAQADGSRQSLDALKLALAAEAANAYIELRWAQNERRIENDNIVIRERALKLTQDRLHYGLATQLDVERAQNQLDDLASRLPRADAEIRHQLDLIAVYAGRTPEAASPLSFDEVEPVPMPTEILPQTMPSDALLRRPDVRVAYAALERRAAEVGAAHAERYPHFRLSLSDGLLSASYLGLPTLTDNLFSAALNATSPIFDAGRITADIDASESRMRESELGLHQTMLQALREIEDARSDLISHAQQVTRLRGAVTAADTALRLSDELYKGGATSFLDVLTAQDAYLQESDALNNAQRDHALAAVSLYRALGGWNMETAAGG